MATEKTCHRKVRKSNMCCAVLSQSVGSDSLWPHGLQATRLLCPWGFSRQEYWSGLPCPPPGDRPDPGIKPWSPALRADSWPTEPPGKPNISYLFLFFPRGSILIDTNISYWFFLDRNMHGFKTCSLLSFSGYSKISTVNIQQISNEHLLGDRHCFRCWDTAISKPDKNLSSGLVVVKSWGEDEDAINFQL